MKLIIKKKDILIKILQIITRILEKKQTLPILENVLIKSIKKKLFFLSTNINIQIITYIKLEEENNNLYITVNGKKLLNILKSFSKNKNIFLKIKNKKLILKSKNSKFSLQIINPKNFPIIKEIKNFNFKFKITQKKLKKLFNMVYFAMAQQDIRPYLNGVLLKIKNNKIYTVATDGYRLAIYKEKINNNLFKKSIIIPKKTIIQLQYLLKDIDSLVKIKIYENKIKFIFLKIKLISKLIKGKYPDYKSIIPNNKILIIINRKKLLKSLERISILTSENFQGVQWIIKNNFLKLFSINSLQETSEEIINIKYIGKTLKIGFNINFLLDVLNNLNSKEINFFLNKNINSSILINIPNKKKFFYIIMPMYI
ncbi:DNA polymerase III subunit beta [Candidatus Zinderia endosymbiont of Aphrophora alni]|uniref:DNA polymerase III subunit beta n=1 Tax=Candidatus Zinderia endosymbiont of Aphrophora alni TaxID=3077951 RepID=UPI0030CFB794